jgi:DNA/RNA endonuclease YhcR with UshA esterase domain
MENIKAMILNSNLKQKIAAGIVAATIGGGYYYAQGTPVAPSVAATSKMNQDAVTKFTVLSGKDFLDSKTKQPKSTILNDTTDYKQASLTIYIDRNRCPQWNYASLQGKTITVRGHVQTYQGKDGKSKPEIKVTEASQITVN